MSLALFALLLTAAAACAQAGQTISVADGDVAGLITAINTLNTSGGGTIDLASSGSYSVSAPSDWWYGPNAFPAIASTIAINGNGATISRASGSPKFRFFFVSSGFSTLPAGSLTLNNLTLTGGLAQGGSGGAGDGGGGGGAGLGGAIYNQGTLILSSVTFASNAAQGGSGGPAAFFTTAGGGGGLGGNGGGGVQAFTYLAAGGGGGFKSDGGTAGQWGPGGTGAGMGGSFLGSEGGGLCSGATTSSYGGNGGPELSPSIAGGGGGGGFKPGENGEQALATGAGGGGAQGGGAGGTGVEGCPGSGGAFGGGGGGGDDEGAYAVYAGAGGGGGGVGGGGGGGIYGIGGASGGFGGGGAADGGIGGFGGGGGGGSDTSGTSVFAGSSGGGNNCVACNSGGGAGLGGAIFNHLGTLTATDSSFISNTASGTTGVYSGTANGFGGAIFNLNGNVTITGGAYSSDSALDSNGNDDTSDFLYNLSHNAGNSASGQTPDANVTINGITLSQPTDVITNQVDGTAQTGISQTINFVVSPSSPVAWTGNSSTSQFTVSATSSSGLPVTLFGVAFNAGIQGRGTSQVTYSPYGPGTFLIDASQEGNSTYLPASASITVAVESLETPVISLATGTYVGDQTVTISDNLSNAAIYYTTDGTPPTSASTRYTGAIPVNTSETLSAIATTSGLPASGVASATYSLVTPPPTFNPAAGSSVSPPQGIILTDSAVGAVIYYASGPQGTVPTNSSTVYTGPVPAGSLSTTSSGGTSSAILSAIAQAPGMAVSSAASGLFPLVAATPSPTLSPSPGTYSPGQMVSINGPLSIQGTPLPVTIFYTTDGSEPTTSSLTYSAPITLASTTTIRAIALAQQPYGESAVVGGTYTIPQIVSWIPATQHIYSSGGPLGAGVLDATDSIPATIAYTAAVQPSGAPVAISSSTVLTPGSYVLTVTFTPDDSAHYPISSRSIPFSVQNMNVFVGGSNSVASFYNDGTLQSLSALAGSQGLAVDPTGNVWSVDLYALVRYTNDGIFANALTNLNLVSPISISIDGSGNLWITDASTNSINAYAPDGTLLLSSAPATLNAPIASSIDISGNVWIANSGGATITELLGAATPTVPLATGTQNAVPAGKP